MDILKTFCESFWSVAAFKRAAYDWKWKGILYFLLLCAVSSVGATFVAFGQLRAFYKSDLLPALESLQGVSIKDGILVVPQGEQIDLKNASGEVFGVVTPGHLDANAAKGLVFSAEKDRISFYMPDGGESFLPLEMLKEISQSYGDGGMPLDTLMRSAMDAAVFIAPPAIFLTSILLNGIYAAIMSAAAFIISRSVVPSLGYWKCARMGLVSLTPPVLIDAVCASVFGVSIPGFVYALISCALLVRAIHSMRSGNAPNAGSGNF